MEDKKRREKRLKNKKRFAKKRSKHSAEEFDRPNKREDRPGRRRKKIKVESFNFDDEEEFDDLYEN